MKKNKSPRQGSDVHRLAWLLDESIRLPGGLRIGLDGILGLIPGVGDLVGMGLSGVIIADAARRGVSGAILARMVINVLVETVVGAIPLFGDLFDFVWKANTRNLRLMEVAETDDTRARRRSIGWLALLLGSFVVAIGLSIWLLVEIVRWMIASLGIGSL